MALSLTCERLKEHSKDNIGSGTEESVIQKLELSLNVKIPEEYREFLIVIGYAEIFGDELFSIYEIPDIIPCNGLHWQNKNNEFLIDGYLKFFSNDIDGVFYLKMDSAEVFLNTKENIFANSFTNFVNTLLNE